MFQILKYKWEIETILNQGKPIKNKSVSENICRPNSVQLIF